MEFKNTLSFYKSAIKPFKGLVFLQLFISVIWAIDLSLRPYLIRIMIDRMPGLGPEEVYARLIAPTVAYVLLSALMVTILRIHGNTTSKLNVPLKTHIVSLMPKNKETRKTLVYSMEFLVQQTPKLIKQFIDQYFAHVMAFIFALITYFHVSWRLGVCLAIWLLLSTLTPILYIKKTLLFQKINWDEHDESNLKIRDFFQSFSKKGESTCKKHLKSYKNSDQNKKKLLTSVFSLQGILFVLYQAACLFFLITGFKQDIITHGDFPLVLTVNIALSQCLWSFSKNLAPSITSLIKTNNSLVSLEKNLKSAMPNKP